LKMGKSGFFDFFRIQFSRVPPVLHKDLSKKTVVVIGANTGLGLETARHFANMGAGRLILGCRSKERGEAALKGVWHAPERGRTRLLMTHWLSQS
jgi:retinol dehydrogenase 12